VSVAHQRAIREAEAARDPRPPMPTLAGCSVVPVTIAEAAAVILRYEWLGTMPTRPRACYGLRTAAGEIAGAVVFGDGPGTASRNVCGPEWRARAVALERGACVHWAHEHAGSFLVAGACRAAAAAEGWRVFFAYADPAAGEAGVIYRACGWRWLGASVGRGQRWRYVFTAPNGRRVSDRAWLAHRKRSGRTPAELFALGWTKQRIAERSKFVGFYGPKRERIAAERALRYPVLPYPREAVATNRAHPTATRQVESQML
jgi:hypothetical protein